MGIDGHTLLLVGVLISVLGMLFGLLINRQLKNMPVHQSMREISELIYETCKTYLIQQGKFLMILVALHRRDRRVLLRRAGAVRRPVTGAWSTACRLQGRDHPALQPGRHRRQLRRRVVRHPRQHLRQQPHGVREPSRQAVSPATRFRSRPA